MGEPTPTGSWHGRFRKRGDQRSFYLALLASGVFHLSMVTIFNIVIYFPRHDTSFYEFTIVPLSIPAPVSEGNSEDSSEVERDGLGGEKLALRGGTGATLPAIQLPTLEFAELERLRVRQEGLQSLSRYDDLFQAPTDDSWSRFSRGLSGMSRSLSRLRLSGESGGTSEPGFMLPARQERIVHRPAEGFEAGLVWSTEPRDRKLLFAPPIEALWDVDVTAMQRPIELVLQVNALGRVVNVFSPNLDERELVDAIQMTALQYRFEPLSLEEGGKQTATVRIVREGSRAAP
jgi:hypothetical protein